MHEYKEEFGLGSVFVFLKGVGGVTQGKERSTALDHCPASSAFTRRWPLVVGDCLSGFSGRKQNSSRSWSNKSDNHLGVIFSFLVVGFLLVLFYVLALELSYWSSFCPAINSALSCSKWGLICFRCCTGIFCGLLDYLSKRYLVFLVGRKLPKNFTMILSFYICE